MSKEIQDQTFIISVKTFFAIAAGLILLIGEYIVLQKDIDEAKRLPEASISKIEFQYKYDNIVKDIELLQLEIEGLKREIYK